MLPNDAESPQVPPETFSSLPIIRKVGLGKEPAADVAHPSVVDLAIVSNAKDELTAKGICERAHTLQSTQRLLSFERQLFVVSRRLTD